MPPRTEKGSSSPEPRIKAAERRWLVSALTESLHIFWEYLGGAEKQQVFDPHWRDIESRLVLIGMAGILNNQTPTSRGPETVINLSPQEVTHLRRLVALESDSITPDKAKPSLLTDHLLEKIKEEVKPELAEVELLHPEDVSTWPAVWRNVLTDLDAIKENLDSRERGRASP